MTKIDLRRHIQPLVAKLGEQLPELVWANVTAARDRALEVATAHLAAELDAALTSVARVADRDHKPDKSPRAKPKRRAKPRPEPEPVKRAPTCSKCGAAGHNARTCPAARADQDEEPDDAPVETPPAPPHHEPVVPIVSLPSRRRPRRAELPPPTPEWLAEDRREELVALSEITLNRKLG